MTQVPKIAKTIQKMEDSDKMGVDFTGIVERANINFNYQIKETIDMLRGIV